MASALRLCNSIYIYNLCVMNIILIDNICRWFSAIILHFSSTEESFHNWNETNFIKTISKTLCWTFRKITLSFTAFRDRKQDICN